MTDSSERGRRWARARARARGRGRGVPFTRMMGCGNDFVILDAAVLPAGVDLSWLGQRLCDRRQGLGADGLLVVQRAGGDGAAEAAYRVAMINADGLPAEMCGNGARCVARYAHDRGIAPADHAFLTDAGRIGAHVAPDGTVRVALTEPGGVRLAVPVTLPDGRVVRVDTINTGVPHCVIWTDHVAGAPVSVLGPIIRHHAVFAPHGTNVNWAQPDPATGGLALRTYERGVEAETLACGTGSAAAAILGARRGLVAPPVPVRTRQGGVLTLDFRLTDAGATAVTLTGPATYLCRGEADAALVADLLPAPAHR